MQPVIRCCWLPVGEKANAVEVDVRIYQNYRGSPTIAKVALGIRALDKQAVEAVERVGEELKKMPTNRLTIPPGTVAVFAVSLDDVKGIGKPYPMLDYLSLQFVVLLEGEEGMTEQEIEEIVAILGRAGISAQKPEKKT